MKDKHASNSLVKYYEDNDVIVRLAPHEKDLEAIVLDILKRESRPLTVKEIHKHLEAIASEEKIRKTLYRLSLKKFVIHYKDGRYELLSHDGKEGI